MKISLAINIITTTLACSYCFSQDLPKKVNKFHIGFTSSINTAFIQYEEANSAYVSSSSTQFTPKVGFKIGGILKYDLSKRFSLASGLSYGTRKIKFQSTPLSSDNGSGSQVTFSADEFNSWLEMPLNLNFVMNPKSTTKLFIDAGFSARRLLSARRSEVLTRSSGNTTSGPDVSIYSTLNDWSLFGSSSIGIQIPTKNNQSFILSITIDQNFTNIIRDPVPLSNGAFDYANVVNNYKVYTLGLNASYLFN